MYAGIDAWILTRLFDSIIKQSGILNINDAGKKTVKSLCKEYSITVPDPVKNFIVSTAVPDERTKNTINSKETNENKNEFRNSENSNDNMIIMQKSLPLNAMKMRELGMPKNWEVPEIFSK